MILVKSSFFEMIVQETLRSCLRRGDGTIFCEHVYLYPPRVCVFCKIWDPRFPSPKTALKKSGKANNRCFIGKHAEFCSFPKKITKKPN